MIAWTQGKQLDDYTQQLLTLLGQRGIPYEAIRIYIPGGPGTDAYWDYRILLKNHQGLPTSILVGPYINQAPPAAILDMALARTDSADEIKAQQESGGLSYTYSVHLGPFGLYGELRPNKIAGSGCYGGYATPPDKFGTPPPILPPPMVEQLKPVPPAPVVQQPGQGSIPDASGIAAVIPPAPPALLGLSDFLVFLLTADVKTIAKIKLFLE